jgi:hypothetical protein
MHPPGGGTPLASALRKSGSYGSLNGFMKIRRGNGKSYSGRSLSSFAGGQPSLFDGSGGSGGSGGGAGSWGGAAGGNSRGGRPDGAACSSRLRVLSFYLTVFISGCLLAGFLLSLSPQQQLERSSTSRVMLQQRSGGVLARRGLYTAGSAGEWPVCCVCGVMVTPG